MRKKAVQEKKSIWGRKKERESKNARMNKQGMNVREVIACFRKTERNTEIRGASNPFTLSTVAVGHVLIMTVFLFASVNILSVQGKSSQC